MTSIENKVHAIVDALEDVKAQDILVIDTSELSQLFERMIIASAQSTRQTKALAEHVSKRLKEQDIAVQGVEGGRSGEWVLVDAHDVIVHIMQPAVRAYYDLEGLWGASNTPNNAT